MNILVVTPVPTHPTTHGNRARVKTVVEALRAAGHRVMGLYLGFEPVGMADELAMHRLFDGLVCIDPPWMQRSDKKRPGPSLNAVTGRVYGLDDWGFDAATSAAADLCTRWRIDAVWVNYVWCSFVLEAVPADIPTVIDTHDIFADRHKVLAKTGVEKSFFYTRLAEEKRGLQRADHVIAIQDTEADLFRTKHGLTSAVTIGHLMHPAERRAPRAPKGPLSVGYLASDNPINRKAFEDLDRCLRTAGAYTDQIDWQIAGPLCDHEMVHQSDFRPLGLVEDLAGFYSDMDVVINPHIGGTGLKIKSVEALMHRCPLVATPDAMIGLDARHAWHHCPTLEGMVRAVQSLADDPAGLADLQAAGDAMIEAYSAAQFAALDGLLAEIAGGTKL